MKNFISVHDILGNALNKYIDDALDLKYNPFAYAATGKNKTLGLVFMNPSLRTRMSMQKAAINLGMNVMVMNMDKDGWNIECNEGAVMNGKNAEHIKDAAGIMGLYCDIIGIRCFPSLENKSFDYSETLLNNFIRYCKVPVINMESATRHPLQSFADLITIKEHWQKPGKPRIVLTWAPHIKPLPQAVANSFSEWVGKTDCDFFITQPKGFELAEEFTSHATIVHDQYKALEGADFIYVKNWSSYKNYGTIATGKEEWMLHEASVAHTNNARIMHCLPVRRNVELSDELLDGPRSLVLEQGKNRIYAAQTILKQIIASL